MRLAVASLPSCARPLIESLENPFANSIRLHTVTAGSSDQTNGSMEFIMKECLLIAVVMMATTNIAHAAQMPGYPPLSEYMMPRAAEIELARTAAPSNISGTATVRAPICFNELASRVVLPYYELRAKLAIKGESPDQIAHDIQAAYDDGTLPKRTEVSFAYMWSGEQNLAPGIGHWHPHLMIFAPNYTNAMVGANPFGSPLPQLSDDAGTPFSVIVVPVDMSLFVQAPSH
jgi:hypothetical protein